MIFILNTPPNGEYLPAAVDHGTDLACRDLYLLHQGIQRRIRITIVHEHSHDLVWRDVQELVIGRIRNTPESDDDENSDTSVQSLGLFPGEYIESPGEDRTLFRFEAAWDSSLHNSLLLNRVTPHGETIYMTVSAYLQLGNCVQPLTITKDLCLVLYGRDSRAMPRSLRSLFLGAYKYGPEANRITGVYEACLKRASEAGLQRRQRRVLDTSSTYVRGEENLHGWRPRGDSLIFEHQWELEKIQRLAEVEGTRHRILLASKLGADAPCNTKPATSVVAHHHDYTKSEKEVANLAAKAAQSSPVRMPSLTSTGSADSDNLTEAQKQMLLKYVRLMQGRPLVEPPPPEAPVTPSDEKDTDSTQLSQPPLCEPVQVTPPVEQDEQIPLGGSASLQQHEQKQQQQQQARESPLPSPDDSSRTSSPLDMQGPQFVCEVEEVRISPVVSRKGYLNVLDNRTNTWVKRWVVSITLIIWMF
ncbi:Kinesin-like [Trinorchestia longiramus]|nr:Kinesin-like [Trinorchestia longiramus]